MASDLDGVSLDRALYDKLRVLAEGHMKRERGGHTLQATALVHEAIVKVAEGGAPESADAFFASRVATAMRRVLVDWARARAAEKRTPPGHRVSLSEDEPSSSLGVLDVLVLEEALVKLEARHPRQCRVVELRYLCGLSIDETAEALGVSPATVDREWATARARLLVHMRPPERSSGEARS